jgi:5-methylcytosine-specific restriction endonuclease McrA
MDGANSFAAHYPEAAEQWHPDLNGDLRPEDIPPKYGEKVWWQCPADHDHIWHAPPARRSLGHGCPYCSGRFADSKRSLAILRPEVAAQWHADKNGDLSPLEVTWASNKKVWWQCPESPSHVWQNTVSNRTFKEQGCPFCSGRQADEATSLESRYPLIAAEWHPTRNGEKTADSIRPFHETPVWWQCLKDPSHEWESLTKSRVYYGLGCPHCADWPSLEPLRNALRPLSIQDVPVQEREAYLWRNGVRGFRGRPRTILVGIIVGTFSQSEIREFIEGRTNVSAMVEKIVRDPRAVLRMPRPAVPDEVRMRVYQKDSHQCCLCGDEEKSLEVDHFVPAVLGGPSVEVNYWTLCKPCNREKSGSFPDETLVGKWLGTGRPLPAEYWQLLPHAGG